MNIEVGKFYRTRSGDKAFVAVKFPPNPFNKSEAVYPFQGFVRHSGTLSWTANGTVWRSGPCDSDLVEEWREPRTFEVDIVTVEIQPGYVQHYVTGQGFGFCGKTLARKTITLTEGEGVEKQ